MTGSAIHAAQKSLWASLIVVGVLSSPAASQDPRGGARIFGRVIEQGRQSPVSQATVTLIGVNRQTTSDDAGRFLFRDLAAGRYRVTVERLGYRAREDTVTLADGQFVDVVIPLTASPVELAPISVIVRSRDLERLGFYDRRENETGGYFITAAEIEQRVPQFTSDVFQKFPSIRVAYRGAGQRSIVFTRGDVCLPDMYLDGLKMPRGDTNVDRLSPSEIAGIEVYIGAMTPLQYRTNSCGAILLWTKRGGE